METPKGNLCKEPTFNEFYTTHVQAASNFAFYKCGNQAEALDLVQEAFVKLWENCAKVDFSKAKSYLWTTVNHMFLNSVRHQKVVLNYAKETPYIDRDNQNPEFLLEEDEFKAKLLEAIEDLTPSQREVFLLNRIEGKKYREIADELDVSQKTVEKHMSAALKLLRAKFDNI
ncbi:MAG: RNA polymerase sigma-70 factor [Bacteroidia bacterium]|nr:RNA polymerase sigma-70 factor [Bacteroidia bacterium]NND26848.1 RNA polymerase sigma-70 factor [Flavobacteriaceae bacterium]MBT8277999.1 RNA polymerase sigma-70 factor [Bacteroidia bacterium]NNK61254.1 RNA polymerase sigma-70 factor [Flavobacteriaceae bacterium]NNL32681.1 RNA polymerase sigma-70 factor [Flavobacteriaceae bacterium]